MVDDEEKLNKNSSNKNDHIKRINKNNKKKTNKLKYLNKISKDLKTLNLNNNENENKNNTYSISKSNSISNSNSKKNKNDNDKNIKKNNNIDDKNKKATNINILLPTRINSNFLIKENLKIKHIEHNLFNSMENFNTENENKNERKIKSQEYYKKRSAYLSKINLNIKNNPFYLLKYIDDNSICSKFYKFLPKNAKNYQAKLDDFNLELIKNKQFIFKKADSKTKIINKSNNHKIDRKGNSKNIL